ncbi:hypothetical protein GCM10011428_64440 [Streptomyces violaceus]
MTPVPISRWDPDAFRPRNAHALHLWDPNGSARGIRTRPSVAPGRVRPWDPDASAAQGRARPPVEPGRLSPVGPTHIPPVGTTRVRPWDPRGFRR